MGEYIGNKGGGVRRSHSPSISSRPYALIALWIGWAGRWSKCDQNVANLSQKLLSGALIPADCDNGSGDNFKNAHFKALLPFYYILITNLIGSNVVLLTAGAAG